MSQSRQETLTYYTAATRPPDHTLANITNILDQQQMVRQQQRESDQHNSTISRANMPAQSQVHILHEPTWDEIYLAACPPFLIKAILSKQCMIAPIQNLIYYLKEFKRNWTYPLSPEGVLRYMQNADIGKMPTAICNTICIGPFVFSREDSDQLADLRADELTSLQFGDLQEPWSLLAGRRKFSGIRQHWEILYSHVNVSLKLCEHCVKRVTNSNPKKQTFR